MITGPLGLVDLARMTRGILLKSLTRKNYGFNPMTEMIDYAKSTLFGGLGNLFNI